jgi:hypothetical protein
MRRAIVCTATLWFAGCTGTPSNGMLPTEANPPVPIAGAGSLANNAGAPSNAQPTPVMPPAQANPAPANGPMAQGTPMTQGMPMTQAAPMTQGTPMAQAAPAPQGIAPPVGFKPNAMAECGLHTKWAGDEFCILPPPPDKGFQLHIGPTNYDNPETAYILPPGQENVHTYTATSANDHNIDFYVRQYRMRPGAHHTIVKDTSTGRRLSGSDVNQDHPVGGITAPENAGIGIPLTAHAPISVDHHAINTTDKPLLQEVWVNFWYVDAAKVTESTTLLYDPGNVTDTIAPHADIVMGPYACDIQKAGRLISMFGHVHANDVRFTAWRTRQGKRDVFYEAYHWQDPLWLEFTSLSKNQPPNPTQMVDGGWTGILDLEPGDTIGWECHEVNQQDSALRFTNQTYAGWMCIIIGDLVGTKCVSRIPGLVVNPSIE